MEEEILRFDVLLTPDKEIEIGVTVKEIEVEGYPEFGEEYGQLAHLYAGLVVEHVGMNTEMFMNSVSELQAVSTELTPEERSSLEEDKEGNGEAVLLYSFPVIIMEEEFPEPAPGETGKLLQPEVIGGKQLGVGFERSPKAEVLSKVYGDRYHAEEAKYENSITDEILNHGTLFLKAVSSMGLI
ncbi:MAG: hypothetical protein ACI4KL_03230 [Lentihominibacter sp.]